MEQNNNEFNKSKTKTKSRANNVDRAKSRKRGILLSVGIIVLVSIMSLIISISNRNLIEVVMVDENSISANQMLTDANTTKGFMSARDYKTYGTVKLTDGSTKQAVVLWSDRASILNKRYAAYYIRKLTPVYWDSTIKEQAKKNSYLYSMKGELIKLDVSVDDFGNMLVPGDSINVRASYSTTDYSLPSEEVYQLAASGGTNISAITRDVDGFLFSGVSILDMLNSSGDSIFDIYYDFISKSKADQAKLLANDSFIKSVKPTKVLLEVTAEEVDNYISIKGKSPTYTLTLLPRTGTNAILDSLGDIQSALTKISSGSK